MDKNEQQNDDNPSTVIGSDITIIGNLEAAGDLSGWQVSRPAMRLLLPAPDEAEGQ